LKPETASEEGRDGKGKMMKEEGRTRSGPWQGGSRGRGSRPEGEAKLSCGHPERGSG
jgi:hypothetical protein